MPQTQAKPVRNQSIECARVVAAVFVVFIHCKFPGAFGQIIAGLGHFAVPMFFAISGYFSYRIPCEKILARMKHILKLYVLAELAYLLWNLFAVEYGGGSSVAYLIAAIPEPDELANWLFLNIPPYVGHLWYLLAMAVCYLVLWGYVRFFGENAVDYRPLYLAGVCLMADHLTAGVLAQATGILTSFFWCRTALLFGIPMFALGIFLREYQERIMENFRLTTVKEVLLIAVGGLLTVVQLRGGVETGSVEFGTIVTTVGLMLFLAAHPTVSASEGAVGKLIGHFGFLSTAIYVLHLMGIMAYSLLLKAPVEAILGTGEPWLEPLIVLGLTLAASILCEEIWCLGKRIFGRYGK